MKSSVKEQIITIIRSRKHGWAFTALDFLGTFQRAEIDKALSTLASDGDIRRVLRGLYDLPMYSSLLNSYTAPDIDQVAHALARKFNWTIFPDGNTALNYLGLSTQMVSTYTYLSNGPTKTYSLSSNKLYFKRTTLKELALNNDHAVLTVQAIRAVGEKQITDQFIRDLSKCFSLAQWGKIVQSSLGVTIWIQKLITKAHAYAMEENNG